MLAADAERWLGPGHVLPASRAHALEATGLYEQLLSAAGRLDEADAVLRAGYEDLRAEADPRASAPPRSTLERLAELARARGDAEALARWEELLRRR